MQLPRQEVWRLRYQSDPYLRDLTNEELLKRAGDLTSASLFFTSKGLIGLQSDDDGMVWMERFAHALEELKIRGLSYKQEPVREAMYIPKPAGVQRAVQTLARRKLPESILAKFGRRDHMAALLQQGAGRISPASFYSDPSLGRARTDNETRVEGYIHPADAHRFFSVHHGTDGSSTAVDLSVPYLGNTQIQITANTDFYVYCMASTCDARLFEDFDKTCVVFKDPNAFTDNLKEAISKVLPGWQCIDAPVEYIDPFFARPHQLTAHLSKHFRYRYQKEYRLLWLPPTKEAADKWTWDHITFQLGPLTQYAELIWV